MDSQPRVFQEVRALVDLLPEDRWVEYPGQAHGFADTIAWRKPSQTFVRCALIAFIGLFAAPVCLVISGLATISIR